ncbi:MAG TPA: hypothetical protein VIY29_09115, partial [Ktedonobacteraceae bacterium]
ARLAVAEVPVILTAMAQEHERAVGGWQAEWVAIPNLFRYTASAVERVRGTVGGLRVDPARMSANLDLTGGLIMAESLVLLNQEHTWAVQMYSSTVSSHHTRKCSHREVTWQIGKIVLVKSEHPLWSCFAIEHDIDDGNERGEKC